MNDHSSFPAIPMRSIRAFVWDLADEGLEDVLHRLAECGFDGLHLALAFHGGRFYCPHNPRHAIVHAPDGVLYFQPLLSCYEQIRPRVHPEYGSGAFVARTIARAHDYGMNLTAWIALLNNATLAAENPDCSCRNAMDDVLAGTLCPAHPAVRGYAQALVEDLAHRVGVDAIEIENFAYPSHRDYLGPRWSQVHIGPNLGYLLSLCFCEHCRRRGEEANLEMDDLANRVEMIIRQGLAGDIGDRRIGDEIADPYHPVSRFARVRYETITSLIDDLTEQTDGGATRLQLVFREEPDDIWRWGVEPHILRQRGLHATIKPSCTATATSVFVGRYAEVLQIGQNLAADIALVAPPEPGLNGPTPADVVEACLSVGVDRFVLSHYGLATYDMLDWACMLSRR